ncbi:unnamed protein product [Urochloa humidicola]
MEGDQGQDLWAPEESSEGDLQDHQPMDSELESRGLGGVLDFIREDPIGVTIMPASLRPPPLAAGGAATTTSSWALLDLKAYIADRRNETTAIGFTRAGHEIHATLCAAAPPRVSHLCVHCPAPLTPADLGTEPAILAHCGGGLIFFMAAVCNASVCFEHAMQDFFVYRAAARRRPSLTRLPHPGLSRNITAGGAAMVGLLRCSGGDDEDDYVIAALGHSQGGGGRVVDHTRFDLHRFDSREGKWATETLQLNGPMSPSPGLTFFCHGTHKVVALGRGFMGWVDLCRGIVFCDVLAAGRPELHYILLPADRETMPDGAAAESRDVAVVQGCIEYVEHRTKIQPWSWRNNGTYVSDDWTVTMWGRKFIPEDCRQRRRWRRRFKCHASQISGSLPNKLLVGFDEGMVTPLPPLQGLHTGHPVLSLDEDDVVYVLAKVDRRDDKAFVLAVNMRDGTLQAADSFGAERTVGISLTYTQYRTSDDIEIAQCNDPFLASGYSVVGFGK